MASLLTMASLAKTCIAISWNWFSYFLYWNAVNWYATSFLTLTSVQHIGIHIGINTRLGDSRNTWNGIINQDTKKHNDILLKLHKKSKNRDCLAIKKRT